MRKEKSVRDLTPEDEAAEKSVGARFAEAWGLQHRHVGRGSHYDGVLHDNGRECFVFELKNRNIWCDGKEIRTNGQKFYTLPLSKQKVEALYKEAYTRKIPALVVFQAKENETVWWVDVAKCLNIPVTPNSGRTKSPRHATDIEDCVYIPLELFAPMEQRYA